MVFDFLVQNETSLCSTRFIVEQQR